MKFRTRYIKLPIALILFFCFGIESFGLQERPVRISPIQIKWNNDTQVFHAYFDVTNDTPKDATLTSIIIFKIGTYKRWRGSRLPIVKAHQTGSYKISFSPGIMLKNEYVSITVNLYGKDYVGLIDQSSRYLNISSRRVIENGKTQIELTERTPETRSIRKTKPLLKTGAAPGAKQLTQPDEPLVTEKKTLIVMGPAKKRLQLLATERFQNVTLAPVSTEEKKQLAAGKMIEPPPKPPSAPENLKVTPEKHQNRLSWNAVDGATAYHLYWSTSTGVTKENGQKIEGIKPGFVHTGLTDDAPIYYVLTAEKNGIEGPPSNEATGKPLSPPKETPVLTITPGKYQNQLTWNAVEGATSYHLYWSKSAGVTPRNGEELKNVNNGYIHTGLNEAVPFFYILTAEKDGLEGTPSAEVSAKPIVPPRDIPQLSVKSGDGKLQLSWTAVDSATEYHLYWGITEAFDPSEDQKAVLKGNTHEHSGLENDQTYYYKIAAANPNGVGAFSAIASGTPKRLEASVAELLEGVRMDEFSTIQTDPTLLVVISDVNLEKQASLKRAEELKELDISSRDKLISLYIAEGKSESVARVLSGQLSKEPENLNLSLSLSKVYHEQGDIKAALKVLNSSLNRISLSARIALNQELKTSVRKGASTLTTKSEEAYLADEFSKLGISLLEKQKYVEALSAFQSLYSLSQDYPMVKYYLGLSRHGLKQYNQAKLLFVEQAEEDLKKKQLMDDLAALTVVLATTLEIPTIKDTRGRYVTLQEEKNTPEEAQAIAVQIATLDALLAEAEKRRLAGLPDLGIAMADDFSRTELQPGQKIRFSFVATNFGKKQSEAFRVYYQLKHEQGLSFDIPAFDRFQPLKAEQAKHSWEKEILIPDGVVPGKYRLIANIEQTGGKGEVSFENNRAQSAPEITVIPPVPDLEIQFTEKTSSMPIETGQTLNLELAVTNIGFKDSPSFEVDYFLENEDGDLIDLKVSEKHKPLQKGNKSETWKKQLPISVELEEGRYQIVSRIRLAQKAVEQNSDNNSVATGFNLNYTPPFTDISLSFEQEPPEMTTIAGESFSVRLKVENSGNSGSSAGTILYHLVDEDGDEIRLEQESSFPILKKDQSPLVISQDFKLPEDLPEGTYRLTASLELEDDDLERNEENNQTTSESRLKVEPSFSDLSLAVALEDREHRIKPGDSLLVKTRLKNAGNRDAKDITISYIFDSRSGNTMEIQQKERVEGLAAGTEKVVHKTILIPETMEEGLYRIIATAELDESDFEKDNSNNADQSAYLFSYIKPEPEVKPVTTVQETEPVTDKVEETEEQKVTNWARHAAAISLAIGGAWMAKEEDQKYRDASDREDELEGKYASSQSDAQVASINSELESTRDEKELYAQNTNLWTTVALIGVGWEVYNIFFWEPDQAAAQTSENSGFNLDNKWAHASAVGIATLAFWQSHTEMERYNDLSDENDNLEAQYKNSSSEAEIARIKSKIASNRTEMENHVDNANIFDGITLAAVGFESYLLWKAFSDPDAGIVKLRYQNSNGFQLKPYFAYEKVGLNLKYNW